MMEVLEQKKVFVFLLLLYVHISICTSLESHQSTCGCVVYVFYHREAFQNLSELLSSLFF